MENWLQFFEKKHQVNFFEQDSKDREYNIAYFEDDNRYTWRVKINHNLKTISIWKYQNKDDDKNKAQEIVNDLLKYSSKWADIGLATDKNSYRYSILHIENEPLQFQIKYGVKESLNAFGRKDWSEF